MLSRQIIVPISLKTHRRRVTTRVHKSEDAWDPDDQRRINENKNWRAGDPEEDAWDIDKERDAARYKRESLESVFRLKTDDEEATLKKMREKIDKWEEYIDKEMGSYDSND